MQNNDQKQIVSAIIIAGMMIGGAILLKDSQPEETTRKEPSAVVDTKNLKEIDLKPVNKEDHILGNRDAKIIIVEYSDTECPFCKIFHKTMQELVKQKSGEVAWVYRHFPLYQGNPPLHPKALKEAEATECAFEQGGNDVFWKYLDRLFAITPANNGLEEKELMNIADYVNLNSSSFYTCLQSGKYKSKVDKDLTEGIRAGVGFTPYSFILVDGVIVNTIEGAQPLEKIEVKLK